MEYSQKQIEIAKTKYNKWCVIRTLADYDVENMGIIRAEQDMEFHNKIVKEILNGNKEVEKENKLFFLNQEAMETQKKEQSKAKLTANKDASADILQPIKDLKKIGEFGKWLNQRNNQFRQQHFNKKYTIEAVNAFLETI